LHVTYEYILAGLMIFLILMMTQVTMSALMTRQLTYLEQSGGYKTAEKIFDALLLSPGDPPDWGRNFSEDPSYLGLADQNSLRAYVLDPYKVLRLQKGSTGYISPAKARRLLGLRDDYHFSLRIFPALTVEIQGNGSFTITVRNLRGSPVPNVNVTGYYVSKSLSPMASYPVKSNITRIDGSCTLEFQYEPDHVLVVCATVFGVRVVLTEPPGLNFRVEGGRVFKSDIPLITEINYSTGSVVGFEREYVSRYVEIDGSAYIAEFTLWK
jgi:hypothetical protein